MQNESTSVVAPRNDSSSVRRALTVLDALVTPTVEGPGASLVELSVQTGLNKSTLLRLLGPLKDSGLAEQRTDGRYRVGVGAVRLGGAYLSGFDLREAAKPILERLALETGETIHLLVYSQGEMTYIEKIAGPSSIQMASRVGDRVPAYCTASGKVFLAYLPPSNAEEVIAAGMPPRTPNTITDRESLLSELALIRQQGYGVDDIENEPDIRCVSTPVFDHNGDIVAAVSTSGPAARVQGDLVGELALLLRAGADELSQQMGMPQPPRKRTTTTDPTKGIKEFI